MGFNTQPYLNNLFNHIRNENGWVAPVAPIVKLGPDKPRDPPAAVIIHIKGLK
jgi:hypothetical protein